MNLKANQFPACFFLGGTSVLINESLSALGSPAESHDVAVVSFCGFGADLSVAFGKNLLSFGPLLAIESCGLATTRPPSV